MTKHLHAELMMQYAEDASKYEFPYSFWQYNATGQWHDLKGHPEWDLNTKYRRKPLEQLELVKLSFTFMKPLKAADFKFRNPDEIVYFVGFGPRGYFYVDSCTIRDVSQNSRLMYHTTEWNAQEHVNALNHIYYGEKYDHQS